MSADVVSFALTLPAALDVFVTAAINLKTMEKTVKVTKI